MKLIKFIFPLFSAGGFFGLGGYSYFSQKKIDHKIERPDYSIKTEFQGKLIFYKEKSSDKSVSSYYKWKLLTDNEYKNASGDFKERSDDNIFLRVVNSINKTEAEDFLSKNFASKNLKNEVEKIMRDNKNKVERIFGLGILEQL